MNQTKAQMFKTATATVGCAYFKAGDFVAVSHYANNNGKDYFLCENERTRKAGVRVVYPSHHLTNFVI